MIVDLFNEKKARFEKKFLITEISKSEAESIIKLNLFLFSEIFYERRVNNIYLDSLTMDNYNDNVVGHSQRFKVRIRWYGETLGKIEKPVLEIKIKQEDVGNKLSFPLKPFVLDESFSQSYLQENVFLSSSLPAWVLELLKGYRVSLLNTYKRKYFQSSNKKFRITLDSELEFFKISNHNNLFLESDKGEGIIIVELKYPASENLGEDIITNDFPFRLTKSSKYVSGIDFVMW
jgi:SPX domain protein involved in polyphosphate accumulation